VNTQLIDKQIREIVMNLS